MLPGIIDTHAHLSRHFGSAEGHAMVAQTGVVTALDLAGDFDDLVAALRDGGAGLNVAFLHPLIPGRTLGGMLLVSPYGVSQTGSHAISHEVIHREGWR